jgi:phosphatidylinositol 4-kinase type 2
MFWADEEPYGSLNPKWTKWFHRNILSIVVGFGRACLLPNFSYLSEAGASLLSDRLYLYIVPPTELASLSSPAFFYDYIDRRAYQRKDKPLPEKIGSLQLFMNGYKDAGDFLKEHPWPGRPTRDTLGLSDSPSHREKRRNWTKGCRVLCGRAGFEDDSDSEDADDGYFQGTRTPGRMTPNPSTSPTFAWTQELMADFRLELVSSLSNCA